MVGDCSIHITVDSIQPSHLQITAWADKAKALSDTLSDSTTFVSLAGRVQSINDFATRRAHTLLTTLWNLMDVVATKS
ncbi:hypothetical protein ACXYUI_30530, partial [Klebsiella pneumoniae]